MKLVLAVLNIWFFILCSKKKKNRNVGGSSIRVIPKSRSVEMEPTQRRNTYTPVMEKTQRHTTQEGEEKKKLTFATAEQLETNDEKKRGTPEGIKLSKDSKKFKLRTAELPTSKEKKEPMRTAETKKDSKDKIKQGLKNTQKTGSKSNENMHTAEKLSNEKKAPQEKPTQKRGSKGKRVTKENIKDKPAAQENIKDKPVPQQDKKEKPGLKENNKDEPVPKTPGLKENKKEEPVPKAKIEAEPTPEEKIGGKPVPVKRENNKKNDKADKQTECKTPEKKSIEEFKTAEEGESPKEKKSPPSSREPSFEEPERKHSEYLIYRAEIIGKDKQKTEVKDKPKMMGKSKATRSPNPKGLVDSVECG